MLLPLGESILLTEVFEKAVKVSSTELLLDD